VEALECELGVGQVLHNIPEQNQTATRDVQFVGQDIRDTELCVDTCLRGCTACSVYSVSQQIDSPHRYVKFTGKGDRAAASSATDIENGSLQRNSSSAKKREKVPFSDLLLIRHVVVRTGETGLIEKLH
jgi:hypothetical protein